MQVLKNKVDIKNNSIYFSDKDNICFLDIETTGLSRKYNFIYLVGFLYFDIKLNSYYVIQFFIDSKDKEKELLTRTINFLKKFEYIINYNGTNFDIPFINERCKQNNLNIQVDIDKSFDIYSILRKNKNLLNLDNLKLETVEEYLGIYREDQYSGLECIYFYKEYQETLNKELKDKILLHNFEDLVYLNQILKIIDIIYAKNSIKINTNDKSLMLIINEISFTNDFCHIDGSIKYDSNINISTFEKNYNVSFNKDKFDLSFIIEKGLIEKDTYAYFFNLNNINLNPSKNIFNNSPYLLPCNIALLQINQKIFLDNIKTIITILFHNIYKKEVSI